MKQVLECYHQIYASSQDQARFYVTVEGAIASPNLSLAPSLKCWLQQQYAVLKPANLQTVMEGAVLEVLNG